MRILFLDDDLGRREQFIQWSVGNDLTVVLNAPDAIRVLGSQPPFDLVFLDHDLADEHYVQGFTSDDGTTGDAVARWLCEHPEKEPRGVVVHSWNTVGGKRMYDRMRDSGLNPLRIFFGPGLREFLRGVQIGPDAL